MRKKRKYGCELCTLSGSKFSHFPRHGGRGSLEANGLPKTLPTTKLGEYVKKKVSLPCGIELDRFLGQIQSPPAALHHKPPNKSIKFFDQHEMSRRNRPVTQIRHASRRPTYFFDWKKQNYPAVCVGVQVERWPADNGRHLGHKTPRNKCRQEMIAVNSQSNNFHIQHSS